MYLIRRNEKKLWNNFQTAYKNKRAKRIKRRESVSFLDADHKEKVIGMLRGEISLKDLV